MIRKPLLALFLIAISLFCACTVGPSNGTNDEAWTLSLVKPDGSAARGAEVAVRMVGDTSGVVILRTTTDSRGRVDLSSLAGRTVSVSSKLDAMAEFRDSVFLDKNRPFALVDTLRRTGVLVGSVPHLGSPAPSVWLLGTGIAVVLDSAGGFRIEGLAPGAYTLLILPAGQQAPISQRVSVSSDSVNVAPVLDLGRQSDSLVADKVADSTDSDGLVAWYPFEGNANDSSGRGHDGAAVAARYASGVSGLALSLDGTGGVRIPQSAELDLAGAMTVSAWILPATLDSIEMKIVTHGQSSTSGWDLGLHYHSSFLARMGMAGSVNRPIQQVGSIVAKSWQHLAAVYNGDSVFLFLNGGLVAHRRSTGSTGVPALDVHIGEAADRDGLRFAGSIDDVKIWRRALSPREIRSQYQRVRFASTTVLPAPRDPIQPGPSVTRSTVVADAYPIDTADMSLHWPCNGNAKDASVQGNDADSIEGALVADRFGRIDGAYSFDGNIGRLVKYSPKSFPQGLEPRTISVWFTVGHFPSPIVTLVGMGDTAGNTMELGLGPKPIKGLPYVWRINRGADAFNWRTNVSASEGAEGGWHHVAVTFDGVSTRFYLDGAARDSSASLTFPVQPQTFIAGAALPGGLVPFYGKLDDIMVFRRVLSDAEIRKLADWK